MHLTREQIEQLAKKRRCPRCDFDKTFGNALCRRCRSKLPPHMRTPIEDIANKDQGVVANALRAAVNYFNVHFASIRKFGGGRKR